MAQKDLHHRLTADSSSLEQGMRRGGKAMTEAEKEAKRLEIQQRRSEQAAEDLGQKMLLGGAAIAAGLALATRSALEWESAWAGVTKTVDGTPEQMAALEEEIRALTQVLPASHTEIAAVAAAAGQLGVQRESVVDFTRVMIDMGEATNLSADQAATALARLMNIMSTSPDDVDRLGSAIVDLGNSSATTEAEIVEMALRIAGAGNAVGMTESDVLAFAAALSSVGVSAESGGSSISRVFTTIDKAVRAGSEEMETFAEVAGMSGQEFAAIWRTDAAGAVDTFVQGLGRMQAEGEDVNATLAEIGLSELLVADALRRLSGSGDVLTNSLQTANGAWEENNALTEEAAARYQTTEARMSIAKNQVNDFAIDIGTTLLPAVGALADGLGDLAGWLGDLPGPIQTTATVLAVAAAALLLLGGAALIGVPKVAAFKVSMDQLAAGTGRAAAAARGLRTGMSATAGFMAGPWGAAIGVGIAAVTMFAAEQAMARGEIQELTDTLDKQSGAVTEDTRVWIANALEKEGAIEAAQGLGLSAAEVVDAVLGEKEAIEAVNDALGEHRAIADANSGEVQFSQDMIDELRGKLDEAEGSWERTTEAVHGNTDAAQELNPEQEILAENLGVTAEEAEALSGSLDELDKELRAMFDSVFGLQNAQDDLTGKIRAFKEQIKEAKEAGDGHATSLDGQSEAAINNREAAQGILETYGEVILKTLESAETQEEAEAAAKNFEEQMKALEEQTGVNITEMEGYNDIVGEIERLIEVHFELKGDEAAKAKLQSLKGVIDSIPETVRTNVDVQARLPNMVTPHQGGTGGRATAHQFGGMVPGVGGPDSQAAFLTPGEFVTTPSATQRNLAALEAANAGARLRVEGRPGSTSGGDGTEARMVNVNLTAYSGQFSLRQVEDDLRFAGVY